jgi:hypothetical protein
MMTLVIRLSDVKIFVFSVIFLRGSRFLSAEVTCDTTSVVFDPLSYPNASAILKSTRPVVGRCPEDRQQQQRFSNGATTEVITCAVKGSAGILNQKPTSCKGLK